MSAGQMIKGALIQGATSAVVSAFLGTLLNSVASVAMRPVTQKLESTGAFDLNAIDVVGQYGENLVEKAKNGEIEPLAGQEREMEMLIAALFNCENPCIVGEAGVGKTALVEGLAILIAEGKVPDYAKKWIIYKVDFPSLIIGKGYGAESNGGLIRLRALLELAKKNPNIIIFIDEVHQFSNFADLCKTYLDRRQIRLVGATTSKEFDLYLGKDPALERRFKKILVNEPSEETLSNILMTRAPQLERQFNIKIPEARLQEIIMLTKRYQELKANPDRNLKLLLASAETASNDEELKAKLDKEYQEKLKNAKVTEEEVVVPKKRTIMDVFKGRRPTQVIKRKVVEEIAKPVIEVSSDHVRKALSLITNIPIMKMTPMEYFKFSTMNLRIKSVLLGQDQTVDTICEALKKARIELNDPDRIRGAFLLAGASGVGKTYLAEMIGEEVGNRILIDAAQYNGKMRMALVNKINSYPYTVVVFDGIEKAKPETLSEISSILDSGILMDSNGVKVSFKNTIVLLTANTGPFNLSQKETINHLIGTLGSGILSKVDDVLVFNSLSEETLNKLTVATLKNIEKVIKSKFNVGFEYDDSIVFNIVKQGIDPIQGARGITKYCTKFILDFITKSLLNGELSPGDKIVLNLVNDEVNCSIVKKAPEPVEEENSGKEENGPEADQIEEGPREEENASELNQNEMNSVAELE